MSRFALDQHHHFRDVLFAAQGDQKVQVIGPRVYRIEKNSLFPTILPNVRNKFAAYVGLENRLSVLRTEHKMDPDSDI